MNCKKCGNVLNPTDVICANCGEPVNPPVTPVQGIAAPGPVATNVAPADVAVNPNVMVPNPADQGAGAQAAPVASPVSEVAAPAPTATPMATADVAVNPTVMTQGAIAPNVEGVQPTSAEILTTAAPVSPIPGNPNTLTAAPASGTPEGDAPTLPTGMPQPTPVPAMGAPMAAPTVDPNVAANTNTMTPPVAPGQAPVAPDANAATGKKMDVKFIILVAALVVVIIALGVFVALKLFGGGSSAPANATTPVQNTATDNNPQGGDEKNPEQIGGGKEPIASIDTFESMGYVFNLPSDLKHMEDDGLLSLSDGDNFLINFTVVPAPYDEVSKDTKEFIRMLEKELDITVTANDERRESGVKYILMDFRADGNYGVMFFSKLDDDYTAYGTVFAKEVSGYPKAFEYISEMIKNANTISTFTPSTSDEKDNYKYKTSSVESDLEGVKYSR